MSTSTGRSQSTVQSPDRFSLRSFGEILWHSGSGGDTQSTFLETARMNRGPSHTAGWGGADRHGGRGGSSKANRRTCWGGAAAFAQLACAVGQPAGLVAMSTGAATSRIQPTRGLTARHRATGHALRAPPAVAGGAGGRKERSFWNRLLQFETSERQPMTPRRRTDPEDTAKNYQHFGCTRRQKIETRSRGLHPCDPHRAALEMSRAGVAVEARWPHRDLRRIPETIGGVTGRKA